MTARRRNLAIGIGLALALIALLAWWLGRGDVDGAGPSAEASRHDTAADHARTSGADPRATAGRAAGTADARLTLEGRVVDETGAPVAGASIRGTTNVETDAASAVSDADGRFALRDLPAGQVWIRAMHEDAGTHARVYLIPGLAPITLRLERGLTATITVVDPDGGPITGATVDNEEGDLVLTTDTRGQVRVRGVVPPHAGFMISAGGFAPAWIGFGVASDPGGQVSYTVMLRRGAALSGVVVDVHGRGVAGAEVFAERIDDVWRGSTTAGLDGTWQFPTLAAGTHVLTASAEGHAVSAPTTVLLDGVRPATVELRLGGAAPVAGRVVDDTGAPVANAAVVLSSEMGAAGRTTSDAAGAFRLPAVGLGPVTAVATAGDRASASTAVTVGPGGVTDLELVVFGGVIAGVAVDARGEPIEGLMVTTQSGPSEADADTDARGHFELRPLAAGSYRVVAWRSLWQVEEVTATAATGDTDVRLVFGSTGTLTGVVTLDGAPVTDYHVGAAEFAAVAMGNTVGIHAADGRFTRTVAAGPYVVLVAGEGFATKVVEGIVVADGATVDVGAIAVERGRMLRGRVVDAGGAPVGGAVVRAGERLDLIDDPTDDPGYAAARGMRRTVSAADGTFTIAAISPSRRGVAVEAEHPAHGRSRRVPLTTAMRDVELVLAPTGTLAGTVVGATSSQHLFVEADKVGFTSVSTTLDGRFELAGLAPGRYEVRNSNGLADGVAVSSVDVTIAAGKTTWIELVTGTPVTLLITVTSCQVIMLEPPATTSAAPIAIKPCPAGATTIPFVVAPGSYQICTEAGCTPVTATATPARQPVDHTNPVPPPSPPSPPPPP